MRRGPTSVVSLLVPALLALAGAAPAEAGGGLAPPRVESLRDPLGIDVPRPRFSWVLQARERGVRQTAYRILVASSPDQLRRGEADVWDSGRVASDENAQIPYGGPPLSSRTRYHFTVRVWDERGRQHAPGAPGFFETGLLDPGEWKARFVGMAPERDEDRMPFVGSSWIWAPDPAAAGPAPTRVAFRHTFTLAPGERIRWAELFFAGPGAGQPWDKKWAHHVWVNDRALPLFGAVESDPRALIVTDALRPGENRIAIHSPYWPRRAIIAALRIELEDGRVRFVRSDGSWRQRTYAGPVDDGWRTEPTDAAPWAAVAVRGAFGESIDAERTSYRDLDTVVPPVHLRRSFTVDRPVARARLYVTAAGIYEPRLNGRQVGRDVLAPGWTDYHKRLRYQTYDVTAGLRRGENVLGAVVASGWYSGRTGMGQSLYGFEKALLAQLHIDYRDGSTEVIATDGSWRAATGPWRRADMLDGEVYDARRALGGWDAPGYRDEGWVAARVLSPKVGRLEAQIEPPVRITQALPARAASRPATGVQIFDFGQNLVGWVRLQVRAPAGTVVTLRYGEMLNRDGTLFTENLRTANVVDRYVAAGRGPEVYESRFTFHGFRYVEISGHPTPLPLGAVTALVIHNDLPVAGRFETSHPLLNRLQSNIVWGQRGNFLTVPTDCPQRDERLGWTGDINVFARTATFNMDSAAFLAKFMVDVEDGQREDGRFPDVAPGIPIFGAGNFGWADVGVMLPALLHDVYADRRVLERHYDAMKRWVDFRTRGAKDYLNGAWSYGDWVSPPPKTPNQVIGPIYHAASARLLARIAGLLGKDEDAAAYEDLFRKVKAAWNRAYVKPDGKIEADTQTVYVLALRYQMLPDELRPKAVEHLAAAIDRAGGHLATGFLGTAHLLPALSENGRHDLAYDLLLKETYPSWLYTVKNGATTMWERWDSYSPETGPSNKGDMNSYNHYAFGAVGEWMYAYVAGLDFDPSAPGWKRIRVRPVPGGGLTHARAEHHTIRGTVASAWKIAGGTFTLDVTIPVHATALVHVPAADAGAVREGSVPAARAPGVRFVGMEDGAAVFEVGSGRYRFTAPRAR